MQTKVIDYTFTVPADLDPALRANLEADLQRLLDDYAQAHAAWQEWEAIDDDGAH